MKFTAPDTGQVVEFDQNWIPNCELDLSKKRSVVGPIVSVLLDLLQELVRKYQEK